MKSIWPITFIAAAPIVALVMALQSCAGVGGPAVDTGGGGGTSVNQEFLALLSAEQQSATAVGNDTCASAACHGDTIKNHWSGTKHAVNNVTCERCHGPGSAHAAAPTKTNILTLPKSSSPIVCGQCHGEIYGQFQYAGHNTLVTSPVSSASTSASQTKSSRCIACHSGLFRSTVYERGKDIANFTDAELTQIAKDTIAVAAHTANCNTCHNPHMLTGNPNSEGADVQLRHKTFNTDTTDIGPSATPDKTTKYNHICAQCHNGRGTDPADAKLTASSSRPSMHDSNQMNMLMGFGGVEGSGPVLRNTAHSQAPGQCVKCHMPDARHTFTVSYDKGCAPCHTAADAAARASSIKGEILDGLLALKTRMEAWALNALGNKEFWDYSGLLTEEGLTPPNQNLVVIQVKRARHNYYFIIRSGDYGVHNAPYAKHLLTVANDNLDAIGVSPAMAGRSNMSTRDKLAIIEQDRNRARQAEMNNPDAHD